MSKQPPLVVKCWHAITPFLSLRMFVHKGIPADYNCRYMTIFGHRTQRVLLMLMKAFKTPRFDRFDVGNKRLSIL